MDAHRPGPLKQRNKAHKSAKKRLSNKDGVRARKISISSLRSISSKGGSTVAKTVRKNQLTQLRNLKREEILSARRGIEIAPVLIAVLNFGDDAIERNHQLLEAVQTSMTQKDTFQLSPVGQHAHFTLTKFRTSFEMIFLDNQDLKGSLDIAKIANVLLIVHPSGLEQYFDNEGHILDPRRFAVLDAIYNHSLPLTVHAVIGFDGEGEKAPKKNALDQFKKSLTTMINKNYPGSLESGKLRPLLSSSDMLQFFHYCSNIKRDSHSYSSKRSQLLVENAEFIPSLEDPEVGFLNVEGFVRNSAFNVNSLVYIPEFGEFQLDSVQGLANPFRPSRHNQSISEQFNELADPEVRPSLSERVNPIETVYEQEMDNLDELDDDFEMEQAEKKKKMKIKRTVPKGTSDYQSAWICEDEEVEEEDDDDEEGDDDEEFEEQFAEAIEELKKRKVRFAPMEDSPDEFDDDDDKRPAEDNDEDMEVAEGGEPDFENYDETMDMEEETTQLAKFREQHDYQMFPDEIDTPGDVPARERFRKFKGLKSFRTSYWDAKENLPADYSRISQFENFNRTKRRLYKTEPIGAEAGYYIRANLINVPKALATHYLVENASRPMVVYQLLAHEHKVSVMNIVLKKVPTYASAVQSKEELIFVVGCRRFTTKPIFSAHSTGDKHKYEKYLRDDVACVATIYAPITFPPASVLVFKKLPSGREQLVATGSLLDCNPDRLIIKRFILSGHPFKINRKHAVVRYMFFTREDILWFRPVELRTKYGRRGHIQEPLGTHGHMKCIFDRQLCSQDTVMLCLYKRVFPKWTDTV